MTYNCRCIATYRALFIRYSTPIPVVNFADVIDLYHGQYLSKDIFIRFNSRTENSVNYVENDLKSLEK